MSLQEERSAMQPVRDVASEMTDRSRDVMAETRDQAQRMAHETGEEVRRQLDERGGQLAERLRTMSDQLGALREGRTDEAQPMMRYVDDARSMMTQWASRLESGGVQGLSDDLRRFARRRPGVFLAGAGVAGFLAGRMVRAGAEARADAASDDRRMVQSEPAWGREV